MNELIEASNKIVKNDAEQQFEFLGKLGPVDIPYSYITDEAGKLAQIIRLVEKEVEPDTILMFYRLFLTDAQK